MNKKMKKTVTVMSICLGILMAIAVALVVIEKKDDLQTDVSGEIQNVETDQSELEVVEEEPVQSENIIVEKAEASYEKWLAASMVVGVSLQYSEFEFTGIYLASENELGNYSNSEGVYITFASAGEEITIHSKPLEGERTKVGTKDLYTEELGFASFDEVEEDSFDKEKCVTVEMSELSELISQSVLVSVYEH